MPHVQVSEWLRRGAGELLSSIVRRLRSHNDPPQTDYLHQSILDFAGVDGGRMQGGVGIFSIPVESASCLVQIFDELNTHRVRKIVPVVAADIKGLDSVVAEKFPGTPLQRWFTHLKLNLFAKVNNGDKGGACIGSAHGIFAPDNVTTP